MNRNFNYYNIVFQLTYFNCSTLTQPSRHFPKPLPFVLNLTWALNWAFLSCATHNNKLKTRNVILIIHLIIISCCFPRPDFCTLPATTTVVFHLPVSTADQSVSHNSPICTYSTNSSTTISTGSAQEGVEIFFCCFLFSPLQQHQHTALLRCHVLVPRRNIFFIPNDQPDPKSFVVITYSTFLHSATSAKVKGELLVCTFNYPVYLSYSTMDLLHSSLNFWTDCPNDSITG